MTESDKPETSNGQGKVQKKSLLDEDMSKDFLSSWKSMSVTGGDDMDFNFEPVAKGNKKAFNFGMDMDFSLDDAFGKRPSFKLDMPDIDFSSSPKKSSKSKEKKTEEGSVKGSHQVKDDKFNFSFDFDGMDDFNFDDTTTKGGKNITGDKSMHSKQASPSYEIECEDLPKLDTSGNESEKENSKDKELPNSEVAVNSKPVFHVKQATSLDGSSCKPPTNSTPIVARQKGTQIYMDKASDALETGSENHTAREISPRESSPKISSAQAKNQDLNSITESKLSHMILDSEKAVVSPEVNKIIISQGIEDDVHMTEQTISKQVSVEVKEDIHLIEEVCSPNGKLDEGLEMETSKEEFADSAFLRTDTKDLDSDRSSPLRLTEKMDINEEKVVGVVEKLGNTNFTLDTVANSASEISKIVNSDVVNAELKRSGLGLMDPPASSDSEPTPAKSMLTRHKLSGFNNFSMVRGKNDSTGMLEGSNEGSTSSSAAEAGGGNGEKLEDNLSSCTKEPMKQALHVEKRENADVLRDGDCNENGKTQPKMVVDDVPRDRPPKKDEFNLLGNRKMSTNVKPSGIQLRSLVVPEREAKSSNQETVKPKDKISGTATVQKSNVAQVNRLSSARIDKIAPSLPSLRISRNISTSKQSSSSIVQDTKSMGNFERISRLQVKSKMVSPVNVQKQTPSLPSLKRKSTEAADVHPSKRLSPSEIRMPKLSAKEVENEVQTQGTSFGGSKRIVQADNLSPKFDFHHEANMENLDFTLMVEGDANVEKAEACAKELDDICSMLKKKHDEAKELLVRALVNNNNLLMLNHPIYEAKIREVQRFASRLMSKEQEAGV